MKFRTKQILIYTPIVAIAVIGITAYSAITSVKVERYRAESLLRNCVAMIESTLSQQDTIGQIDGVLYDGGGTRIGQTHTLVDRINYTFGVEATIFNEYTRVSTTIKNKNQRVLGTTLTGPAFTAIFTDRKIEYSGEAPILGKDYYTYYRALKQGNRTIGVIFCGVEKAKFTASIYKTAQVQAIIGLGVLIVCVVVIFIYTSKISHQVIQSIKSVEDLASGGFPEIHKSGSKDEFGKLSESLSSYVFILKDMVSSVQRLSEWLSSASKEVAATTESFSMSIQNQSATTEEITATIEEIGANSESITHNVRDQIDGITNLADQVVKLSTSIHESDQFLNSSITKLSKITSDAHRGEGLLKSLNDKMSSIVRSSQQITQIVTIIEDVADKTRLLSLNTAIEASRSENKSFSVIADNIAKLAETTTSHITDINKMIQTNMDELKDSMNVAMSTIESIGDIVEDVKSIDTIVRGIIDKVQEQLVYAQTASKSADAAKGIGFFIGKAMDEQQIAIEEIVKSISNMNDYTQQNVAGAEQLSSSAENLSNGAESLKKSIEFFKVTQNLIKRVGE